jgi:hypothetical protein
VLNSKGYLNRRCDLALECMKPGFQRRHCIMEMSSCKVSIKILNIFRMTRVSDESHVLRLGTETVQGLDHHDES